MDVSLPQIRINAPGPGSPLAKPVFARSKAYDHLFSELYNYTTGNSEGGSVLVSGHRGSGKTTLVQNAVKDLASQLEEEKANVKPFLISLHGPDLMDLDRSFTTPPAKSEDAAPVTTNDSNTNPGKELTEENKLIKNVLEHLTISLYRALADEFYNSFEKQLLQEAGAGHLKELIGRLRLELDEGPDISTLREIWSTAGFLQSGMLFTDRHKDQGVQEVVLLATAAQAYRIVTGSINSKLQDSNDFESELSYLSEYKFISKDIINAIFGLASGIAVGAGVFQMISADSKLLISSLIGIVTAFLTNFTFTISSKRTSKRKRSREYQFIRTTDISSLNRELPNLIGRIKKVGLAPVFVVDELDKVRMVKPYQKFGNLIGYLKKLVSEKSFFCFLTDRNYFDFISGVYRTSGYPKEYTYFTHRFYINYTPRDLHTYLDQYFKVQELTDQELQADAILIQYLVLNRANLHTIDLKREIFKRTDNGYLIRQGIRSNLGYRFPIMIQLAIESMMEQEDLIERFDQDSYFFQLITDTLYYPLRCWMSGEKELDISKKTFIQYIIGRSDFAEYNTKANELIQSENWDALDEIIPISMNDLEFLFQKLREIVGILLNYETLNNKLSAVPKNWNPGNITQDQIVWNIILDTIPKIDPGSAINRYLLKKIDEVTYTWYFDYFGRSLKFNIEKIDIANKIALIQGLDSLFRSKTENEIGLQTLAMLQVINSSPDWSDLEISILSLSKYINDGFTYPSLVTDVQNLEEYYSMILRNSEILIRAFVLARFLKSISKQPGWNVYFSAVTQAIDPRAGIYTEKLDELIHNVELYKQLKHPFNFNKEILAEWQKAFSEINATEITFEKSREEVNSEWWETWRLRFITNLRDKINKIDLTIIDMICLSDHQSLAIRLGTDINKITKWTWMELALINANNFESRHGENKSSKSEAILVDEIPAWFFVIPFLKLGFSLASLKEMFSEDKFAEIRSQLLLPQQFDYDEPFTNKNLVIMIADESFINNVLLASLKMAMLTIRYSLWQQQTVNIVNLVNDIKDTYTSPTLIVGISTGNAENVTKEVGKSLAIPKENIFRWTSQFDDKEQSEFRVIRSFDMFS